MHSPVSMWHRKHDVKLEKQNWMQAKCKRLYVVITTKQWSKYDKYSFEACNLTQLYDN